MKWTHWLQIACLTALGGCIGVLVASHLSLRNAQAELYRARTENNRAQEGAAFSCGYLHGQRAALVRQRLDFAAPNPDSVEGCANHRTNAIALGFTAAKDPQ